MTRQAPPDVIAAAQAAMTATGILASVSLGQWALESAWGQRCTGKFNFFGMKATGDQPASLCWTHEVVDGKSVAEQLLFRDFDSLAEAFLEHARRLTRTPFDRFLAVLGNVPAYVHAIAPAYATDPTYGDTLWDLIRAEGFQKYDRV